MRSSRRSRAMTKVRDPSNRVTHRPIERPRRQIWSHPTATRPDRAFALGPDRLGPNLTARPPHLSRAPSRRRLPVHGHLGPARGALKGLLPRHPRSRAEGHRGGPEAARRSIRGRVLPGGQVHPAARQGREREDDGDGHRRAVRQARDDRQVGRPAKGRGRHRLKSLVAELGDSHPASGAVVASLAPKLVAFFAGKSTDEPDAAVVGDVLDILRAAATSHGRAMAPHHAATRDALLAYLKSDGRVAKKRAAQCLAALAASFTDAAAAATVDDVLGELSACTASAGSRGEPVTSGRCGRGCSARWRGAPTPVWNFQRRLRARRPPSRSSASAHAGRRRSPRGRRVCRRSRRSRVGAPGSARFTSRVCSASHRT